MSAKVWAIGAGKGGVGKSFVTASLGISLTKLGQSVLVIDFDLGGANLHTHLGLDPSLPSLQSYLSGESPLANLIRPTPVPRLSLIQGCWDVWEHGRCTDQTAVNLVEEARKLPYDVVLIDLGPGTGKCGLDAFSQADQKVLVTSPEPTSVEKNYRFLEAFILHRASQSCSPEGLQELKKSLQKFRAEKKKGFFSFRQHLSETGGFSPNLFSEILEQPVHIVVNSSRSHDDQQLGYAVRSVCKKYYDLRVNYLGAIDFDNAVWHAVRNREPFLIAKPFTTLSGQFLNLARSLQEPEIPFTLQRAAV